MQLHTHRIVYYLLLFPALLFLSQTLPAQELKGVVLGSDSLPVAGANLIWLNTGSGTTSNPQGEFALRTHEASRRLTVSHVGYVPDTISIAPGTNDITIYLTQPRTMGEVEVSGKRQSTYIAPITLKTEVITSKELEKAACCDLSGCFSNASSVEPAVTNVITDTKELRMIGLSGVYTQVLLDNTPSLMSGLNYNYGISFLPGTLINKIFVVKGANSVLQGYESISGQINVLLKEDESNEQLFFNTYANSFLEKQMNLNAVRTFGNWSTIFAAHTVQQANKVDGDGNSFLDIPRVTRYSLYNKWKYMDEDAGVLSRTAVKYTDEQRIGGQRDFIPEIHSGGDTYYGQILKNKRLELYSKTEFLLEEAGKINTHLAGSTHRQDSWYGTTKYDASQQTLFADVIYTFPLAEENNLSAGLSYRYLSLEEDIRFNKNPLSKTYSGRYETKESVPGACVEDVLRLFEDQLTVISGLRMDYHNVHGLVTTPRIFLKYNPSLATTIRASFGTGFRTPMIFSENSAVLGSSRDVVINGPLDPERAVNFGVNLTHQYELSGISGSMSVDVYRTDFSNQIIADYDSDMRKISFRNLNGTSASSSILTELQADLSSEVKTRIAYTYTDAFEKENGRVRQLPFISKHKVLATCFFSPEASGWSINATMEWHGPQTLPNTDLYPAEFRLPSVSNPYVLLNAQITKSWDLFDIYFGVENIGDTRQANPIINAANPFSAYFEPSFVWGMVKGREAYLGLRMRLFAVEQEE